MKKILPLINLFVLSGCCNAFAPQALPTSVTETHTKTTLVAPPSYSSMALPPPSIYQAPPVVQAPVQASPCYQTQSVNPCPPMQYPMQMQPVQMQNDCQYQMTVPQARPPVYTISIPPTPAPQYNIAIPPVQSPAQCNIVTQPQPPKPLPVQQNACVCQ